MAGITISTCIRTCKWCSSDRDVVILDANDVGSDLFRRKFGQEPALDITSDLIKMTPKNKYNYFFVFLHTHESQQISFKTAEFILVFHTDVFLKNFRQFVSKVNFQKLMDYSNLNWEVVSRTRDRDGQLGILLGLDVNLEVGLLVHREQLQVVQSNGDFA